jgi:hypothetical protein
VPPAINDKEDALMRKLVLLGAATGALAASLPASALSQSQSSAANCPRHTVGFVASGALGIWSLTKDPGRTTYSGTLTVSVNSANRHAGDYKGIATTFTVNGARVQFGPGIGVPPAPLSKVKLIGHQTAVPGRCEAGFRPQITIEKIIVHAA